MERRSFLGALTAASLGVALEGSFTEFARAQNTARAGASLPGQAAKTGEFPAELNNNFGPCGVGRRLLLEQHRSPSGAARS